MENLKKRKFVAYLRSSKDKQKFSILSQRQIVKQFAGDNEIEKWYVEHESGASMNRPELAKAVNCCKLNGYTLIIARLDRLSRSVLQLVTLIEKEKVDFVACDFPTLDTFGLHIHISVAQRELEMIRERTKRGLEQARLMGKKLGKPENLTDNARAKGRKTMQENAFNHPNNLKAGNLIVLLRKTKKMSYQKIADYLNKNSYRTRNNALFASSTVQFLFRRYKDHFEI